MQKLSSCSFISFLFLYRKQQLKNCKKAAEV
jgi:hypothetical protein